jgi:hypothetical protein
MAEKMAVLAPTARGQGEDRDQAEARVFDHLADCGAQVEEHG